MVWESMATAPRDGTPILAECRDCDERYLASIVFWNEKMLHQVTDAWLGEDAEYWSRTEDDFCVDPVRWLSSFEMPDTVSVYGYEKEPDHGVE